MSQKRRKFARSNAIRFLLWRDVFCLNLHITIERAAEMIGYDASLVRSIVRRDGKANRFRRPDGDKLTDGRKPANLHEFSDVIGNRSAVHNPTE